MAARIPGTPLSGSTIDTDRGGMPLPRADKSLAGALAGFGGSLQDMALGFNAEQDKKDTFDDEAKFLLHREQTETALTEAQRQMPADAKGFAQSFIAGRQAADESFLASISPRNRERYALKWEVMRSNFSQKADATEYKARGDYELGSLNSALDVELRKLATDPNYKQQAVDNLGALLGNTSALDAATRADIKRKMAAKIDEIAVTGKYGGDPASLAKALGVVLPGAVRAVLPETSTPGGRMAPDDVRAIMLSEVKRQGLVGTVPPDGAKYGIKTGSAEEWANLFTGLAKHESGLDNRTVGDVGQFVGGSRGLLQLSYNDAQTYGFNAGKPFTQEQLADPTFNAAAGIAIAKSLISKNGTIQGGMGKYWGPISKEGWVPGQGRDRGLPWQQWGAQVGSGPTRAAAGVVSAGSPPPGDPAYSSIPYDRRVQLVEEAIRKQKQADNEAKAQIGAYQTENKNRFGLGIEMEDPSITQQAILSARQQGQIDDKDTTELLKALDAKQKNSAVASAIMDASAQGQSLGLTPFDEKNRSGADGAYERYTKGGMSQVDAMDRVHQASGIMPSKAVAAANGAIVAGQPEQAAKVLQVMGNMLNRSPRAFEGIPGGERIASDAIAYRWWSQYVSPEEAARNVQQSHNPDYTAKLKLKDEQAAAIKRDILSASNLSSAIGKAFDESLWGGSPDIGIDPNSREKLLSDYAALVVKNMETYGDLDAAKASAQQQLHKTWGVSKIQGQPGWFSEHPLNGAIMEYPLEAAFQAAPDAKGNIGHGYVIEQAKQFIAEKDAPAGITAEQVQSIKFLPVTDGSRGLTTQDAWASKRNVPYSLVYSYKTADGHTLMRVLNAPFTADAQRAYEDALAKTDATNVKAREDLLKSYMPWAMLGNPDNGGLSIGPLFPRGATPGQEKLIEEARRLKYKQQMEAIDAAKSADPAEYIKKYGLY